MCLGRTFRDMTLIFLNLCYTMGHNQKRFVFEFVLLFFSFVFCILSFPLESCQVHML